MAGARDMSDWLVDPVGMEGTAGRVAFVRGVKDGKAARRHHPWSVTSRKFSGGVVVWESMQDERAWQKAQNQAVDAVFGVRPRPPKVQDRAMPSVAAIWHHWRGSFAGPTKGHCFACGCEATPGFNLERSHILARAEGGDDSVSNLHILCRPCHGESEMLSGGPYFAWLMS
jgi:hypothetical protein